MLGVSTQRGGWGGGFRIVGGRVVVGEGGGGGGVGGAGMEASECWGVGLQSAEIVGCWPGRVVGVDGDELWALGLKFLGAVCA